MNWFKRRRCEHKYKYYGCDFRNTVKTYIYQYHFICPKCKNEITIDALDLYNELCEAKMHIQKMSALDEKYEELDETAHIKYQIILDYPTEECTGKYVDMVRQAYKVKGIDICEINREWS